MSPISRSFGLRGAVALAIAIALAGCTRGAATSAIGTATPTAALTSTAESAPTPMPTQAPTPTPTATATAVPSPSASPTSAALACTGKADTQAFFVEAAGNLKFDVYCAVLPSSWWLSNGSYILADGGYLEAEYKTSGGAGLEVREGRWCPPSKACIAPGATIGTASFAGLSGTLYLNTTTYTLQVGTSAKPEYLLVGSGMDQAEFEALAAAFFKVPKA